MKHINVKAFGRTSGSAPGSCEIIKYEGNFYIREGIGVLPIKTTTWAYTNNFTFDADLEMDGNEIVAIVVQGSDYYASTRKNHRFVLASHERNQALDSKRFFFQCCGWRDNNQHSHSCSGVVK